MKLAVVMVFVTSAVAGVCLPEVSATEETVSLGIAQARELAVRHNLNVRAQREALEAAGFLARAERGVFEPELVVSAEGGTTERQNTIEQVLSQGANVFLEDFRSASAAVEGVWEATGARYRIGYSLREISNNLRIQPFDPLREEVQNFIGVNIQQPLLRDRGRTATMVRSRIADGEEEIAFQEYRRLLMQVVFQVEMAYWDLYLAQRTLEQRQTSRRMAQTLLEDNRERVTAGKMSELEVLQAEAGVSFRESQIGQARQGLVEASNRLKTLLANVGFAPDRVLLARDSPRATGELPDFHRVMDVALDAQPALLAGELQKGQEGIRMDFARNQQLPQLDLKASFGYNGLDDSAREAVRRLARTEYEAWSVGLEMRIPIMRNVRRSNELRAAQARVRESELRLQMLEIEITNAVHSVYQKVRNVARVRENLEIVTGFNERLLLTEQNRLEEGLSDSRRLLEVENDLVEARLSFLESFIALQKAEVELELVSGQILANRGMELSKSTAKTSLVAEMPR